MEKVMSEPNVTMKTPSIVSPEEWEAARQRLLVKEKELTKARDAMAAERRRMPWLAVDEGLRVRRPARPGEPARPLRGPPAADRLPRVPRARRARLARPRVRRLLDGRRPGRPRRPPATPATPRLVFASRGPQADIERVKARMGWEMPWYTITDGFDVDFGVDEWHGTNAFIRDGDRVFRTYFINSRGDEALGSTWSYLDMTALGRQEAWEDSPEGYPQTPPYDWWTWHDEYGKSS